MPTVPVVETEVWLLMEGEEAHYEVVTASGVPVAEYDSREWADAATDHLDGEMPSGAPYSVRVVN